MKGRISRNDVESLKILSNFLILHLEILFTLIFLENM